MGVSLERRERASSLRARSVIERICCLYDIRRVGGVMREDLYLSKREKFLRQGSAKGIKVSQQSR